MVTVEEPAAVAERDEPLAPGGGAGVIAVIRIRLVIQIIVAVQVARRVRVPELAARKNTLRG